MLSAEEITSDSLLWNWQVYSFHSKLSSKRRENRNLAGADKHDSCHCGICTTTKTLLHVDRGHLPACRVIFFAEV
jgi:hypothetical protein